VDEFKVTSWGAEFNIGPQTVTTSRPLSSWVIGPLKGGMGLEKNEPGMDDRYWYAENVDCARNSMTLGPLVTTYSTGGSFGTPAIKIIYARGKIWGIGNNEIAYLDSGGWTTGEPSGGEGGPVANPTDAFVYYDLTNGESLVVASAASGVFETHDSTGGTWVNIVTNDISYLAEFENRLCGVADSNTGFDYSAIGDIATAWTTPSPAFPNLPVAATGLFMAKDPNDDPILYVVTTQGLWSLDVYTNFYQYETEFKWARDSTSGKAALYAKGDIYVHAGGSRLLKISGGVVTEWGPDDDDGLPEELQGNIVDMKIAGYWIIIAVDGGGGAAAKSSILKRHITQGKWHVVYVSAVTARLYSLCWDDGVLYFGEDNNIKGVPLSSATDNYKHLLTHTYSAAGDLITSYFHSPFEDMSKTAHELWCKSEDMTSTEKLTVTYRIDDNTPWINTDLSASGVFNSSPKDDVITFGTAAVGLAFERIQFKFSLARNTSLLSPKIERIVLKYRVIPPYLEGWTFRVPLEDSSQYRTGDAMLTNLKTAAATGTLLTFYPTGSKTDTVKYVQVTGLAIKERGTEKGQSGVCVVTVGEVLS
jgi:hypothetical protein